MGDRELDTAEIQVQHELLFATVRALEEVLPYTAIQRDRPRPLSAARALLERLLGQLKVHFAAEERADRLGRMATGDPRLTRRIEDLLRDHRQIEALAAKLVSDAHRSDEETAWAQLFRAFWRLREQLAWHEREEDELAFELLQVDWGQSAGG